VYNRFSSILLTILTIAAITTTVSAQPTIYLVRHAEKLPTWLAEELADFHPLSDAGVGRAQRLAEQFKIGSLAAIFSSRTTRTLHTALPLAQKLGLAVEIAEACSDTSAIDSFYAALRQRFKPDQAVLLVSHSNIIPYLLRRAGLPDGCHQEMGFKPLTEDGWLVIEGYDNIWRVDRVGWKGRGCDSFTRKKFVMRQ